MVRTEYKTDGIYVIDGKTYVGVDEKEVTDGFGRLTFTKVPRFIKDVLKERKVLYLGDDEKLLVELPYLLTGDENTDVILTPMKVISRGDNIIEPNEDGSYTIEFKNEVENNSKAMGEVVGDIIGKYSHFEDLE